MSDPFGIVLAPNGNFYVANAANNSAGGTGTISQVTPNGVVTTFAVIGITPDGLAVDTSGNLYVANFGSGTIDKVPTTGVNAGLPTTYATGLTDPTGVTISPSGTLYVAEANTGDVCTIPAGGGSPTVVDTPGENPTGLTFDPESNLYVSGEDNGYVYEYPEGGGGPNTFATGFSDPEGLAVDSAGNLVVADLGDGNGGGDSSSEISILYPNGSLDKNIDGFSDPAYIVALSGTSTVTPEAGSNGAIFPNTPQAVISGSSIGFTATPNSEYAINQWLLNGAVAQNGGSSFTVTNATPNDIVEVTFRYVGPITPYAGAYDGLFDDDSGYLTVSLSANRRFTAKETVGSTAHSFSGLFSTLGGWSGAVAGADVSLQLGVGQVGMPGSYFISGTAGAATVTAWHAAQVASYTVALTATSTAAGVPQISSTATLTVNSAGGATFKGKLPDGQPFTASPTLVGGPSGSQILIYSIIPYTHASPSTARGYLIGSITFPSGVVTGPLLWIKPAQTKGSYPDAIDTGLTVSP